MLRFGNAPVPYTVSWSSEERFEVAPCRFADGRAALCQSVSPGDGTPLFGKPHAQRQREAVSCGLCDICGRALKNRTKVSLSHARVRYNAAEGPAVLQVEPLLHRECAATSMAFCPSLRRDVRQGTLFVRQVLRWRAQIALMTPDYVATVIAGYVGPPVAGHAKVELQNWKDRDAAWLESVA